MNHWAYIFASAKRWTDAHVGRTPEYDDVLWLQMAFGRCILASVTDLDEERDAARD
jgi:hypothetical protein